MHLTKEEILKDFGITPETRHHSYDYLYKSMLLAMDMYSEKQNQKLNLELLTLQDQTDELEKDLKSKDDKF